MIIATHINKTDMSTHINKTDKIWRKVSKLIRDKEII